MMRLNRCTVWHLIYLYLDGDDDNDDDDDDDDEAIQVYTPAFDLSLPG